VYGLITALGVLAVATVGGLVWRRRNGRVTAAAGATPGAPVPAGLLAETGADPAAGVTLLQFSSATCAPCKQVRAVCEQLAGELPGVRHVEVDAETHLEATRELNIWRLPTLLVVDRRGRITNRATGVPDRAALTAAVSEVLTA
jgi:thiol-disulfide isomerase/thioredoxin